MLIFFRELSSERKFRPFFFFFISTHKVPNLINFYLFSFFLHALILIMRSLCAMAVEGGNPGDGKIEGKIVWATKIPRVLNCQNICNIFDDLIFRRSFFLFRKGLFCFFRNFFLVWVRSFETSSVLAEFLTFLLLLSNWHSALFFVFSQKVIKSIYFSLHSMHTVCETFYFLDMALSLLMAFWILNSSSIFCCLPVLGFL